MGSPLQTYAEPINFRMRSRAMSKEIEGGAGKYFMKLVAEELSNLTPDEENTKWQSDPIGWCEKTFGETYTDDVKRLMESVRDNTATIGKSGNGTGKTHAAARIAVWWYKCFPGAQVYTTSAQPLDNLVRLLWGEIGSLYESHKEVFETDRKAQLNIQRSSLEFLTGVTIPVSGTSADRIAKFSGKHAPHLLFIVDEGDAVPDEVYEGIETCMSGGHKRLLVLFNPKRESGPIYVKESRKQARVIKLTAFNHPNVVTGETLYPGAVDRDTTVRRILEWTRPLMTDEKVGLDCFEVPEFLVGTTTISLDGETMLGPVKAGWRRIMQSQFSYMVMAEYPSMAENQLISSEWVQAAVDRWKAYVGTHGEIAPPGITPTMGQDVGELGNDYSMACLRYDFYVPRLRGWQGVDPVITARRSFDIAKTYGVSIVNVDGTGVGAAVAPELARMGQPAMRVMMSAKATEFTKSDIGEFGILRDQMYWAMREWFRTNPNAMIPDDDELKEELTKPSYEIVNGLIKVTPKKVMRNMLRRSPDKMDSLMFTFYQEVKPPPSNVTVFNYLQRKPFIRGRTRVGLGMD